MSTALHRTRSMWNASCHWVHGSFLSDVLRSIYLVSVTGGGFQVPSATDFFGT